MDERKEFLTEENYEKGKKKIMRFALLILIAGILLGGSLIAIGIIKTDEVKKQNEQAIQQVEQNSQTRTAKDIQADMDKINAQIDQIDLDIANLEMEETKLRNEQSKIFTEDRGFSDRYYAKDEEITAKQSEISAKRNEKLKLQSSLSSYETELWKVNSGYNDANKEIEKAQNMRPTSKYVFLYVLGGFIIIASGITALSIYMFGKRREIVAFTAQQIMPVAKEGIEKVTPTVSKAAGTIAQDIAHGITKGIKNGLNDNEDEQKTNFTK